MAITPELYEPPAGNYRAVIAGHGDGAKRLLVIGHNPATHATALALVGGGDPALAAAIAAKFPTAALAVIDFERNRWNGIAAHSGRLVAFLTPRGLARAGEDMGDD